VSATERSSISRDNPASNSTRAPARNSHFQTDEGGRGAEQSIRACDLTPQHRSCVQCGSLHVSQFSQGGLRASCLTTPPVCLSLWLFFFENKKQKMKATTVLLARANQLIAFRHGRLNAGAGVIPLYDSDLGANRAPARPAPRARARRTMRPVAA